MNAAILFLLALSRTYAVGVLRCTFPTTKIAGRDLYATALSWPKARTLGNLVGRCKSCKAGHCVVGAVPVSVRSSLRPDGSGSIEDDGVVTADAILLRSLSGSGYHLRCECGRAVLLRAVEGKVTEHACNAKCMASTGPACECTCGGKNHGSAHA